MVIHRVCFLVYCQVRRTYRCMIVTSLLPISTPITSNLFIKEKKMSKKLLFALVAVLMLASLILTACGGAAPAAPANAKKLFGISMPTKTSTRWISDGNSMLASFQKLGYDTDL